MSIRSWALEACFVVIFLGVLVIIRFLSLPLPWLSYIYFYGLGWPVFLACSRFLIRRKTIRLELRRDRRIFTVVLLGISTFTIVHGVWIFLALNTPYKGL